MSHIDIGAYEETRSYAGYRDCLRGVNSIFDLKSPFQCSVCINACLVLLIVKIFL